EGRGRLPDRGRKRGEPQGNVGRETDSLFEGQLPAADAAAIDRGHPIPAVADRRIVNYLLHRKCASLALSLLAGASGLNHSRGAGRSLPLHLSANKPPAMAVQRLPPAEANSKRSKFSYSAASRCGSWSASPYFRPRMYSGGSMMPFAAQRSSVRVLTPC